MTPSGNSSPSASGWKTDDIPDQTGRRALITGANSGIGYWTALELARKGATVVLAVRDLAKGSAAAARIHSAVPAASVDLLPLDLASLESVRAAAHSELVRNVPLDLLINNAGVMAPKTRKLTSDGFELQFGTNVLGHFALTGLLLPLLERAALARPDQTPRIVTIASIAHKRGQINFHDLQSEHAYSPMAAYAQTKLADLIFARELQRRLVAAGAAASRIVSLAAHPGVANTNLFQVGEFSAPERLLRRWFGHAINAFLNTDEAGAFPTLYAATAPDARAAGYYGPQGWREMRGSDVGPAEVAPQALDPATATRLWSACERLTGVSFL
jgi:NAD(P)-dependent dehydrogenase (short-subunit alcohol dehydrogenase family)